MRKILPLIYVVATVLILNFAAWFWHTKVIREFIDNFTYAIANASDNDLLPKCKLSYDEVRFLNFNALSLDAKLENLIFECVQNGYAHSKVQLGDLVMNSNIMKNTISSEFSDEFKLQVRMFNSSPDEYKVKFQDPVRVTSELNSNIYKTNKAIYRSIKPSHSTIGRHLIKNITSAASNVVIIDTKSKFNSFWLALDKIYQNMELNNSHDLLTIKSTLALDLSSQGLDIYQKAVKEEEGEPGFGFEFIRDEIVPVTIKLTDNSRQFIPEQYKKDLTEKFGRDYDISAVTSQYVENDMVTDIELLFKQFQIHVSLDAKGFSDVPSAQVSSYGEKCRLKARLDNMNGFIDVIKKVRGEEVGNSLSSNLAEFVENNSISIDMPILKNKTSNEDTARADKIFNAVVNTFLVLH